MLTVRDATAPDAEAISRIGRRSVPVQFAGLVDGVVVDAVVTQTYEPAHDGAVRFYERHGLVKEDELDGVSHYERAGVRFPPDPKPFQLVVMRYRSNDLAAR